VHQPRHGFPPNPPDEGDDFDTDAAGLEGVVVAGDHEPAFEAVADVLCTRLGAERLVLPGAGHAVQRAPAFNTALEAFIARRSP
jgi:hypothetical protein